MYFIHARPFRCIFVVAIKYRREILQKWYFPKAMVLLFDLFVRVSLLFLLIKLFFLLNLLTYQIHYDFRA